MLLLFAAHAACPTDAQHQARVQIDQAFAALGELDRPAFETSESELRATIPCFDRPIERTLAASVHQVTGIRAFGDERLAAAQASFAAARVAVPGIGLPDGLVPPGAPLHDAYAAIDVEHLQLVQAATPARASLYIDGERTLRYAPSLPHVVQVVTSDTTTSVWIPAGGELPPYATRKSPAAAVLLGLSAVCLGAAGGSQVLGVSLENRWKRDADFRVTHDDTWVNDRLDTYNAVSIGTLAAGIASAGVGVALAF
ncbi:MAG: hypothetical protein KC656_35555 [Myxococcales bacterium]|nr:hypothetical protein [Myxococcales bacterium]MCB9672098.1 hypothetical protein [Alphaproteobacteria bacterium]MCB9694005.1 hypothetical protein [Alphaproteobacteria bacterium]